MKICLLSLLFFGFFLTNLQAQEFWDVTDFEISNYSIEPAWSDLSFGQQFFKGDFNLPSGEFINVDEGKPASVDMLGILEEQRNRVKRTVDIGSPLPKVKREEKAFEISGNYKIRDKDKPYNDALNSNPYYQNQRSYQNALHRQSFRNRYYGSSFYVPGRNYY